MSKRFLSFVFIILTTAFSCFAIVPGRVVVSGTQFQVCGNRLWMSGCNTPWENWNDFGGTYDSAFWETHFAALEAAGVNSSRIWITCSGEVGININAAGNVTGATAAHWANLDDMFGRAKVHGIYIMATLISFDHFKNSYTTYQSWRNWIASDANIDSYVSNYIVPFLTRYGNNPALWSIDLNNEPEWESSTENTGEPLVYGAINWPRIQTYFAKAAVAIHKWNAVNGSGPLVTVGMGYIKYNTDTRNLGGENKIGDANLAALISVAADKPLAKMDFWSTHYYPWQDTYGGKPFIVTPLAFGLPNDRPAVVGECPNKYGSTNGGTNTLGYLKTDYSNAYNNGWQGVLPWTSNGAGSGDFGDLTNELSGASGQMLTMIPTLVRPVCGLNTPTRTSTSTATRIKTASPTATLTCTVSFTASATGTSSMTASYTPVNTNTFTRTETKTALNTATPTPVNSFTVTATRTFTAVITPTNTEDITKTFTPISSATFTFTIASTYTMTSTPVDTLVLTATNTSTIMIYSPTATFTPENTFTITQTPTGAQPTLTLTNTVTVTAVNTNIFTNTVTATATATAVNTNTFTNTVTATATAVNTNTFTNTVTATATATAVNTNTFTSVPTGTITATATPVPAATTAWGDKFEIPQVLIYPNPCNPGYMDLKIKVTITKAAKEMKVRIYTVGYRRVIENNCGEMNSKETTITIPKERLKYLSAGAYYMVATGKSQGGEKAVSKPQKLIILK